MDLFTPVVSAEKFHKHFSSCLLPKRVQEREELSRWALAFPDRDGKFVKEFQTTFNSSFWELYLFAVFKDYGFEFDWSHTAPDFCLIKENANVLVEAVTANAALGKENEWDRLFTPEELKNISFGELNKESIIRLSNAVISKTKLYEKNYSTLSHVEGKPFVLALAPFEQPHFNLQYNRPIMALLYDYYVDEDEFLKDPSTYPDGPPVKHLGYVEKENGAELPLGIFNDDQFSEISAIIFSTTATWGKVDALTKDSCNPCVIHSIWGTEPYGVPEIRSCNRDEHSETISDGLQVYHNPYASIPVPRETFRRKGVVQVFPNLYDGRLEEEETNGCLHYRQVFVGISDPDLIAESDIARLSE